MAELWYNLTSEQVSEKLNTDITRGLDTPSVRARREKYGKNAVFLTPGATFGDCLKAVGCDISMYLLIILAFMSALFKQNVSAMVVLALIVFNFVTTLFTYVKSQNILRDMSVYAAPMSRVIRNSRIYAVKQSSIVVGDVILLDAGDIVPADARIIESEGLSVLENELSGTAAAKKKNANIVYGLNVPFEKRTNMVYATSLVTEGSAKAVVCACGESTVAVASGNAREIVAHKDMKVLGTLKKYCSVWSLCMLALILVITGIDLILGLESRGLFNIFITGASLACAAMTEYYVIFAYFIIGCGLFGNIKKRGRVNSGAIVKNISTLEEIKDIDTLIVPKKGGFFTDHSSLERIFCSDTLHNSDEKRLFNNCGRTLKFALLASGYAVRNGVFDDPANELNAIAAISERIGIDRGILATDYPTLTYTDEFFGMRCDAAIVSAQDTNTALIRGEAAPLLENCTHYFDDGVFRRIDDRTKKRINDALRTIDTEGCRAVAVISKDCEGIDFDSVNDYGWRLEGILGVHEGVLDRADTTVAACKDAGIRVIAFADEIHDPSRLYFKRIGLIEDDSEILTSGEFSSLDEKALLQKIGVCSMYEGLDLNQKRRLISLLKQDGHTVGVLGRELDDILLIREAEIGFTTAVTLADSNSSLDLGKNNARHSVSGGCEALKYACDVLVSPPERPNGGFNAMVNSMCNARIIYQNLMRMVKYLFTSQIARLVILLYSVIVHSAWPKFAGADLLTPVQILFCGLFIDFAVVLVIAFQPAPLRILSQRENTEERLERPLMHNFRPMLFGLFWGVISIAAPLTLSFMGKEITGEALTSHVFISFVLTQLIVSCEVLYEDSLFKRGHMLNRVLVLLWLGCATVFVLMYLIPEFGALFGVTRILPIQWICVFSVPVLMLAMYELYKKIKR
ncbi:MAG: cation-transporting P-type ATPase [Clostridia bacterium]|nr:cation-transporting P-type ATPase [Clostridia bacterium]